MDKNDDTIHTARRDVFEVFTELFQATLPEIVQKHLRKFTYRNLTAAFLHDTRLSANVWLGGDLLEQRINRCLYDLQKEAHVKAIKYAIARRNKADASTIAKLCVKDFFHGYNPYTPQAARKNRLAHAA